MKEYFLIELINDRPKYHIGIEYEWLTLKDNEVGWEKFTMTEEILRVQESYTIRYIQ